MLSFLFQNENEYDHILTLLKEICLIEYPKISENFQFVKELGVGAQARIDLFKLN